jgi:phenylacetate-CoA ligase
MEMFQPPWRCMTMPFFVKFEANKNSTILLEHDQQQAGKIANVQEKKLQDLLLYLSKNSPFYKQLFANHHIDISAIKTLADLGKLPTTEKDDLQKHNDDFLCVAAGEIVEYTATSGTLGSPVTIALTENDLNRLAYNEYNSFLCADGLKEDIYQLMLTLDRQFMAGIAYYSGIRKIGAGIIRLGPGVPSLQWETIKRLKPTAIVQLTLLPKCKPHLPNAAKAKGAITSRNWLLWSC